MFHNHIAQLAILLLEHLAQYDQVQNIYVQLQTKKGKQMKCINLKTPPQETDKQ